MGLIEETLKKYRQEKAVEVNKAYHTGYDVDVCQFVMYLKSGKLYKDEAKTVLATADEVKNAFAHGLMIKDTNLTAKALTCNATGTVVYLGATGTAAVTTI